LNGKKHTIPSTTLSPGDTIEIGEKLQNSPTMKEIRAQIRDHQVAKWLQALERGGTVLHAPAREDIDPTITERLIIELYSR